MDFLDPKKHKAHERRLLVGYMLVGIAILLAVTVLLYLTYGFTLKQGKIVQNGLIFVSSNPGDANVYLNGERKDNTNTRLTMEAGTYTMRLAREGYRDWQRGVTIAGGDVLHVDYPFLVPTRLTTDKVADYAAAPALNLQSPDRRWLLVQSPGKLADFDMYDLKDPKQIAANKTRVTLPAGLLTSASGPESLKLVEWSNNNVHVMLRHVYDGTKAEYILVDRKTPAKSVNLTNELQLAPTMELTLQNKRYDHYFVHNTADGSLATNTLSESALKPLLKNVVAYKSYGDDTILYATTSEAKKGFTNINIYLDDKAYTIRSVAKSKKYLLELSRYSDSWYAVVGSSTEGRVYVYENPADSLDERPSRVPVPVNILKVAAASRVSFSANSQFVAAENGQHFAVYDIENDKAYTYTIDDVLDRPQTYATWMDSSRLQLVSKGKVVIFDYDNTNRQELVTSLPSYKPYFDSGYRYLYAFSKRSAEAAGEKNAAAGTEFTQTSMRTSADQ